MTPINIQGSRPKVKLKGHASLPHISFNVPRITQEHFAP